MARNTERGIGKASVEEKEARVEAQKSEYPRHPGKDQIRRLVEKRPNSRECPGSGERAANRNGSVIHLILDPLF